MNERKTRVYWNVSKEEFISFVKENCDGMTLSELWKEHKRVYNAAYKRGLIDKLVAKGILVRRGNIGKPRGFFVRMNDDKLCDFIKENSERKNVREFKKKSNRAYNVARERGLVDKLVNEGILVRDRKPNKFYSGMTYDEISNFIRENYEGLTLGEFEEECYGLYKIIRKKGFLDKLVEDGVLIREAPARHSFADEKKIIDLLKSTALPYRGIGLILK